MTRSRLFFGDNLKVLQGGEIGTGSVDLIYLDPPFNSNRVYNVLFGSAGDAQAQVQAFDDTWKWTPETETLYDYLVTGGGLPTPAAQCLEAFRALLRETDLLAYLTNMAPRLVELHRALKSTGSLYIHCDPTASHYLKVLLDVIFGPLQFRNEIIWRRTGAHGSRRSYAPLHDVIFFYVKSKDYYFKPLRLPYTIEHVRKRYSQTADGRWQFTSGGNVLTGPGSGGGDSSKPWRGFDPAAKGRHWAVPGFVAEQMDEDFETLGPLEKLEAAYQAGLIEITPGNAWPTPNRYLKEGDGYPAGDIWAYQPGTGGVLHGTDACIDEDVAYLGPTSPERLGYQTQKPRGLLERIIKASCPPDGVVLDPFCGCGTTLDAAATLGRTWIGIDVTFIAIDLIRNRLRETHGDEIDDTYDVLGVPADLAAAHALNQRSPFEFERWAVSLVRGTPNEKQVGDRGKDGVIRFVTGKKSTATAIVSVKGGQQLVPAMVRELEGVVSKTKGAEAGVLITLYKPTKGMREAASTAGTYTDPWGNHYPKIQLRTVEELFAGLKVDLPPIVPPYHEARRMAPDTGEQLTLGA